ncbi:hypothetical protein BD309DRAFT_130566 [Dichomitus squalens]|nr:hypothetical protein BD309DRAFT_130566 [Dichomitus squalens]
MTTISHSDFETEGADHEPKVRSNERIRRRVWQLILCSLLLATGSRSLGQKPMFARRLVGELFARLGRWRRRSGHTIGAH